ncbi:hypothetical protein DA803_01340 [[Mycoplasma] phocae]|uniref:Uncharacterized protein n=1 Tax=[Mycoplasma] phocae TaxID=142651 RepID=A0A2Z5IQ34_9BACT|nr:hypothetical protein [[Mycoplasma] phocae]AXE60730.1 hypothetical protein DA803_01340 [[Mycoplasma] phocae]
MEITKKRRAWLIVGSILTPITIAGSIGGAIYFVVRNTRKIQKVYWSPEEFQEKAKANLLEDELIESFTPRILYENFISQKNLADKAIKEYDESHPEIKEYIKNNQTESKESAARGLQRNFLSPSINKLLRDRPKPFDANKFLSEKLKNSLSFDEIKFLDFRYSSIQLTDNPKELRVNYEVFLNYEFATGNFETNAQKGTPKSKYYYKSSKIIRIISKNEKWDLGTPFYQNLETLSEKFKKIINEKKDNQKWFESMEFQEKIFKIFQEATIKYDAFPDIYPSDSFDISPASEVDNDAYVKWNPIKGLNNLTITYRYIHKNDNNIKSEIRKKNFVVSNA